MIELMAGADGWVNQHRTIGCTTSGHAPIGTRDVGDGSVRAA
jgi:hypothetical protein